MGKISTYLEKILSARYGKDVRQAIHDAIQQCYFDGNDIFKNTSPMITIKDFVRRNNLAAIKEYYAPNSDGTTRSFATVNTDTARCVINGTFHSIKVSMPITDYVSLKAGKAYSIYVYDESKKADIIMHLYSSDGTVYQENATNKVVARSISQPFTVIHPEADGEYYFAVYLNFEAVFNNENIYVYIIEGEYTLDDFINMYTKDEIDRLIAFDYSAYGLPVVNLSGNTTGMNKDNKVELNYTYGDLAGTCTLKWQGSSSIAYPKKNYTITFDNAFEAVEGWGAQKKYCLKANYIDFSHARNVVSAKLWGQIVKSRATQNDNLCNLPNGGAIDGFPVVVVINGEYQGIYTFNIPKDAWMFGMGDGTTEYVLSAEAHSMPTAFKQTLTLEELQAKTYFEIEHSPDGVEDQTVLDSINALINACVNGGENFRETVEQYMDMESAIDYYIFTCLLCGGDMTNKNYLLGTFDGTKWFLSAYDLDSVFGNYWDGKSYNEASHTPMLVNYSNMNRLMNLIYNYDKEALKARYAELRAGVLSEENVGYMFYNFVAGIPKALFDEEVRIWPGIPGTQTNNLAQIMDFYRLRCKLIDAEMEAL